MPRLNIRLFGKFGISRDGQALDSMITGKVRELLCYLLLHRGRPHSREIVAGQFWGETSTAQSRKYLRKAIWQLQLALGSEAGGEGQRILQADRDWLVLELNEDSRLDVADFEKAFVSSHAVRYREMTMQQAQALQAATMLYSGDLLEGCYQDWCLYERERLQNMSLTILDRLVAYCEANHLHDQAIAYGERILGFDPAHELTHQRLMNLRHTTGDRTGALRQYTRCCQALRHELGVGPSQSTLELLRKIQGEAVAMPKPSVRPAIQLTPWNALLSQLEDATTMLSEVCCLVRKEITNARETMQEDSCQKPARSRSSAA